MIALKPLEQEVVKYMRKNKKGLTVVMCQELLGTTELRKVVSDLKDKGFSIGNIWEEGYNRYGNKVRYKRYFLLGEPK